MHGLVNRTTTMTAVVSACISTALTVEMIQADTPTNVVYAWGNNGAGQVGDGTNIDRWTPVAISGLANVTSVAAGSQHSFSLLPDGTVRAWGSNSRGPLGDGTDTHRSSPVAVQGLLDKVVSVAGGFQHSLAVMADGTVQAWGYNADSQLGNGVFHNASIHAPGAVLDLTGVVSVAANSYYSLALLSNGTVRAWGSGPLAVDSIGTSRSPVALEVLGLTGVTAIAAGWGHSLALESDGTVWAWGGSGAPGDGSGSSATAVEVPGLANITKITAGMNHSMVLLSDGSVRAWGENDYGQLGERTIVDSYIPAAVSGLTDIVDIFAVGRSSFALSADGRLWAWGDNSYGQLGLGDTTNRLTPTEVLSPLSGYRFSSITGGDSHVLAILEPIPAPASAILLSLGGLAATRRRRC